MKFPLSHTFHVQIKRLVEIGSSEITESSLAFSGKVTYKKHTQLQYGLLHGEAASGRRKATVLPLKHTKKDNAHCSRDLSRHRSLSHALLHGLLSVCLRRWGRIGNLSDSNKKSLIEEEIKHAGGKKAQGLHVVCAVTVIFSNSNTARLTTSGNLCNTASLKGSPFFIEDAGKWLRDFSEIT